MVESKGSENQPSVLKAAVGLRKVSKPFASSLRCSSSASSRSKKPLYGTRPTTGNHQVRGASLSG